ncbi:MAG TPA: zf-HC2 domain-containing protein [Blastocatellia bacterium]|nr:zf-HC2 domain-containing protein [Blastocatellia bacterium]
MNCKTCEKLIPLFVEGDLAGKEEAVKSHLAICDRCSALSEDFSRSQRWLHSASLPELDDSWLENMRGEVMDNLRAESVRHSRADRLLSASTWRWLVATAAALVLAILAIAFSMRSVHSPDQNPNHEIQVAKDPGEQPAEAGPPSDSYQPRSNDRQSAVGHSVKKHRSPVRTNIARRSVEPLPENVIEQLTAAEQTDGAEPEMLRIEMQTADPNIRIIWFTPKATIE